MRLAVISDIHVLGPGEYELYVDSARAIGHGVSSVRRSWRRLLYTVRRRFWNWHPEARQACFMKALEHTLEYAPDWVIANGDYAGDAGGTGLSDIHTFESAAQAITLIRELFPGRCHFVFGDHELGKYSTLIRSGGIRLESLYRGERDLGIQSFWHEQDGPYHLIGINSSLFTLDMFFPEAREEEIPEWKRISAEHKERVNETFSGLPDTARILLFCHDPGALTALYELAAVRERMHQIHQTILGHLHAPGLLTLARIVSRMPQWKPKYPVARILADATRGARTWSKFNPIVCPSTFGTGRHFHGGILFIEDGPGGGIVTRRHPIKL